jgi:para-nitrobenzyl esterase
MKKPDSPGRRQWLAGSASLGFAALALPGCATGGAPPPIRGASGDAPVATVAQGELRGRRDGDVLLFMRVPYAADPYLAENRFQPPRPPAAWRGERDATAAGPMPPQLSRAPGGGLAGAAGELTMNIWVPKDARNAPVLVWLPGGAFYRVDASEGWYDGSGFARRGIVVVAVNYRVGIDGFMAVDGAPPNRGLLDQVAALQWVQKNIAAFGGNAGDVTLAGQSAGAQSVMLLMGMPAAQGLFHKAIAQSPPQSHFTPDQARRIAQATAEVLKVQPTAQGLAAVPLPALIAATETMIGELRNPAKWGDIGGRAPYLPVVDGSVLAAPPMAALTRHAKRELPLLIGSTDEEARLYLVPSGAIDRITAPALAAALQRARLPAEAEAVYRQVRPEASPGDMMAAFESDHTFRIPSLRFAENRVAAGAPVWVYQFAWPSPGFGGRLGAAHVVDVPFAFDTLATAQARPFLGGPGYQPLADEMHARWTRFVKTGDPGWARYELATRPTMHFAAASSVLPDPLAERRRLWAERAFD